MISALLTLLILAVIVAIAIACLRYINAPKPLEWAVVGVACIIAILVLASLIGWIDIGVFRYHDVVTVR